MPCAKTVNSDDDDIKRFNIHTYILKYKYVSYVCCRCYKLQVARVRKNVTYLRWGVCSLADGFIVNFAHTSPAIRLAAVTNTVLPYSPIFVRFGDINVLMA